MVLICAHWSFNLTLLLLLNLFLCLGIKSLQESIYIICKNFFFLSKRCVSRFFFFLILLVNDVV